MTKLKQHFIGINKRTDELFDGLFDSGATLMFYYHWKTLKLNEKFKFWDGEWFLHTTVNDDNSEIENIRSLLENVSIKDKDFKYEIVPYNEWRA